MSNQDDAFTARMNRVRAQSRPGAPMPSARAESGGDFDEHAMIGAVLRPQLALVLGAVSLILGRGIAINQFGVELSPDLLSLTEGAIVLPFLVIFGLLLGRNQVISHIALVVGAALAFLCESYYMPFAAGLMEQVYTSEYVHNVLIFTD